MDIYITETKILVLQAAPKEEHAFISKYSKAALNKTIQDFPELEHALPTYTFINSKTGVSHTHDLKEFAQLHGLEYARVKLIVQHPGRVTKGWMFVPNDEESSQAFYNWHSKRKYSNKRAYANSFSVKKPWMIE